MDRCSEAVNVYRAAAVLFFLVKISFSYCVWLVILKKQLKLRCALNNRKNNSRLLPEQSLEMRISGSRHYERTLQLLFN